MSFPNRPRDNLKTLWLRDRLRDACLLTALVLLSVALVACFVVNFFGTDCQVISYEQVHEIITAVTPEDAGEYYERTKVLNVPAISIKDVCLDNGSMVCAVITRDEAWRISNRKIAGTVKTVWDLNCLQQPLVYENLNLLVSFGEFSRLELNALVNAAKNGGEAFCVIRSNVGIAPGRTVDYRLPVSTVDSYVRRAHRVGASKVVIPFFWNLDGKNPPEVYLDLAIT